MTMPQEEKAFSPQESLQLIQSMIDKTRSSLSDSSFYFQLWGWLVFIAAIGQYILKVGLHSPYHMTTWYLMLPGVIISIIYSIRQQKREQVKTYVGESMRNLWMGLGLGFWVLIVIFSRMGWEYAHAFFMLFYGMGAFISGKFLQFRALLLGGLFTIALAAAAAFVDKDTRILLVALAILCTHLVPGYLLKRIKNK
jgi:hypothetical protein